MNERNIIAYVFLLIASVTISCSDEEYALPKTKNELQNDCIKRSIGPNLVGQDIEFAYAMALPQSLGTLESAEVEATIAGAPGTYLEHRAFYTNSSGADVPTQLADPSSTEGTRTSVTFTRDTMAATLRYFYRVPEEARGREVSFTFRARASNGQTVSYSMGPYKISRMDMVLDRTLSNNNVMYISIEDMAVYNAAEAAAIPDKIDLVYLQRVKNFQTTNMFGHALVSPANPTYLDGLTLPAGVDNNTKVLRTLNLRDRHLARIQWGVFIDDIDFETIDLSKAPNYTLNLRAEYGAWVETEDGRYRAFIYVNAISSATANPQTMRISIKRYAMN